MQPTALCFPAFYNVPIDLHIIALLCMKCLTLFMCELTSSTKQTSILSVQVTSPCPPTFLDRCRPAHNCVNYVGMHKCLTFIMWSLLRGIILHNVSAARLPCPPLSFNPPRLARNYVDVHGLFPPHVYTLSSDYIIICFSPALRFPLADNLYIFLFGLLRDNVMQVYSFSFTTNELCPASSKILG